MQEIELTTLNTWANFGPYEKRLQAILIEIKRLKSNVLCFQEVINPNLLQILSKQTQLTHYVYEPRFQLAICSVYPLKQFQKLSYINQSPSETYDRGYLLASMDIDEQPICIANTHLSWKPADDRVRYEQTRELMTALKTYSTVLVAGDFNDSPESESIENVITDGFHDLLGEAGHNSPPLTWDNQNPFIQGHSVKFPNRRIDYLFARFQRKQKWSLKKCRVVFKTPLDGNIYPSDHYGVSASICIEL